MPERADDVRRARTLSIVSVTWGALAAIAGGVVGVTTGSLSLIGFAADSAIDSAASVALVWRFHIEGRDPDRATRVEHAAERIVGAVLVCAAAALTLGAMRALLTHGQAAATPALLTLLGVSLLVLPPLALVKRRVADRIGSVALRNDALLTAAAGFLALVALVAAALASVGLWWADAAGSMVIAAVLAREGWTSVRVARST